MASLRASNGLAGRVRFTGCGPDTGGASDRHPYLERTTGEFEPKLPTLLFPIFLGLFVLGIVDIWLDRPTTWWSLHILVELGLIALSLGAAVFLWLGWRLSADSVGRLERALEEQRADRDAWRSRAQTALTGLGTAIDGQFDEWKLTPSERETALLVLKGFSHKRIAKATGRSDRTVRQHAAAVYRKSGLAGRAELAGFFLGDLPDPRQ